MSKKSGGHLLVECLRVHGVKKIFCVPGESYLDALDGLHDADDIRTITCRQEGGAAFMAEAYGKLTGHPGICFVTRGPGACNASIGVHTAMQDSTPFILLVGQVARDQKGREAFQEVEYRDMFKPPFCKWAVEIEHASDIPRVMREAFDVATSGRPGPVVIALPEDMLCEETDAPVQMPSVPAHFAPTAHDVQGLKDILSGAKNPLVIVGGGSWHDVDIAAFQDFALRNHLPVAAGFRRQDAFDNNHPCYVGALGTTVDPKLCKAVEESDVILAVGTRLGEILTQGYSIIQPGQPKQRLIHVYPDADELNRVYQSELTIHASVSELAKALSGVTVDGVAWQARTQVLREQYLAFSTVRSRDKFTPDLDGIIEDIINALPEDAILTTDAGNFSGWPQRFVRYARPMRLLAPTSGAMGYGVPAAVAASLRYPERVVVGFMGDGGFMMTAQEIATACHEGAHPILLVFNNGMYGTIRMHQEKHYPKRVSATHLTNPDFAAFAASFGAGAWVVEDNAAFLPAFRAAMASKKPALIEIRMDPQQITTAKKLAEL
ncbi:MAG TPA: thiamine pyrophosphate-binding protein [Alphaproteobacteria bacterium]|nr:thiamine pyrophosphate-binding protein [Rhodospirillaceae bacterium]HRJ66349.1 thiamine pyrophosphate-binding protein [Alphaproteobacteria bacterium]